MKISLLILVCAVAVAPIPVSAAGAADGAEAGWQRRLDAIEAELARLRATPEERWLTEHRAEEVRELVAGVLADADTRATMLADRATAGWDDHFFIASADGDFRLEFSGQIQLRHVLNHQSDSPRDDTRSGFENRRTKLKFDGHLGKLEYSVTAAFNRETGTARVEGPYVQLPIGDDTTLRVGRFRTPLLREFTISSKRQLLVERSLVARRFRQARTLGVGLRHETERLRIAWGFSDAGDDLFGDERWLTSGRVELLLGGKRKRLRDFTSFPDDDPVASIGAGILFQYEDLADPALPDSTLLRWSVDCSVETGGANAFVALVGNHPDVEHVDDPDQWGLVVQGGVFVAERWELFGQYVWGDAGGDIPDLSAVTIGVNHYLRGEDLKLTVDLGYGINEVAGFWSSSGAGWRRDRRGEDGQTVLRTQFQLLF